MSKTKSETKTGTATLSKRRKLFSKTVIEIKEAIMQLPPKDFRCLREWLAGLDEERWDKQLERDVKAGKLDSFAAEAIQDYETGRVRRARAKLEKLLLEGMEGEPTLLTDQDWDEMRRRYDERHSVRNGR